MRGCTCTGLTLCPLCTALAQRAGVLATTTEAHISEKAFMQALVRLARLQGFLVYHTYRSTKSPEGFPDLVCVHPTRRELPVFLVELKTSTGQVTAAQQAWVDALDARTTVATIWRPDDLEMIARWLRGEDRC